jgi:hypothetical protein
MNNKNNDLFEVKVNLTERQIYVLLFALADYAEDQSTDQEDHDDAVKLKELINTFLTSVGFQL